MNSLQTFTSTMASPANISEIRPGATVRVHQKIKEGSKTRTQIFEGIVIARKHGSGPGATITVRKTSNGIGVERTYPLRLPTIEKFEVVRSSRVRRAKLYYLRTKSAKETRKKIKNIPATKAASVASNETSGVLETENK